jgi:predicted enzyme related to lactoylglutathione lyase
MASVSFAFTQLFVRDFKRMTEFYSKAFGMREIQRMKYEGDDGMEEVVLACDDAPVPTLVLASFLDGRATGEREVFLGFYSDDLDESVKNVIDGGGTVLSGPDSLPDGLRVAILEDPEGHMIEIMQVAARAGRSRKKD